MRDPRDTLRALCTYAYEWDIAAQKFGPPSETKPLEELSEYDNLDEEWPYRMIPLLLKFDHPLKHMICFHLLIDHHDIELVLKSIHNIQPFDDNVARDKYEKSVQAAIMDIRSMMNGTDYA